MIYDLPRQQYAFDLATVHYAMVARVESAEVHAQVTRVDRFALTTDPFPCPTLAIVPSEQEGAALAAIANGGLAPGKGEGSIADVWGVYGGFAVYLPLDRRIVSVRVPMAASLFVFDSAAGVPYVSGLVWTREIARACGCK